MKLSLLALGALLSIGNASDDCHGSTYASLAPLFHYPPAQSYCATSSPQDFNNGPKRTSTSRSTRSSSTTQSLTTSASGANSFKRQDARAQQWSSLLSRADGALPAFCSCMEVRGKPNFTSSTTSRTTLSTTSSAAANTASSTSSSESSSTTSSDTSTTSTFSSAPSSTTSSTTSSTPSTTSSTTTSSMGPQPSACNAMQQSLCTNGCFCALSYPAGRTVCISSGVCPGEPTPPCDVDADCVAKGLGDRCVYDENGFCPGNRVCATTNGCPQPT